MLNETRIMTAAMLLRLALATIWLAHASLKWFVYSIAGFAAWLEAQGLPGFMAWPVFVFEVVGGMMLLLGIYGRYVSAVSIPILLVVVWTHIPNGWVHTAAGGGWEFPVFLVVAAITHMLLGDGRFALNSRKPAPVT